MKCVPIDMLPTQGPLLPSSSPLLSLVQVPAKLAINLSIHTQHTYDNGVDRTGDRVFRKYSFLHEEREEEKKNFNPQTMLHLEYSLRTEKKNTSAQKHIYHKHMTLQQGETYPALASSHPVQCHAAPVSDLLALVAVQSISEAVEWGRGVMSVMGEGSKRVFTASLSQGGETRRPWPRRWYGEPER